MSDNELKNNQDLWRHWDTEIRYAEAFHTKYWERVKQTLKEYRADPKGGSKEEKKKFNVYYSSIEAVKPSVYSQVPIVDIRRRNSTADKIARLSALIWERNTGYSLECHQNFNYVAERGRDDFLLAGRPVLWERYEPVFETVTEMVPITPEDAAAGVVADLEAPIEEGTIQQDETGAMFGAVTYSKKVQEKSVTDYVNPLDFGHNEARTEDEIRFKYRRHYLNREQLEKQFGKSFKETFGLDVGKEVKRDKKPEQLTDSIDSTEEEQKKYTTARVYEIWDKLSKRIYFWSPGFEQGCLDVRNMPKLEGVFPCAQSCVTSVTSDSVLPIPEYCQVRDQCMTINDLTDRITKLEDRCRVNGACPAEMTELQQILTANDRVIPVKNMPMFEKSGGTGAIQWLPLDQFTATLASLYEARDRELQAFYELTGYSDLMRGVSDPNETAAAQDNKMEASSPRLTQKKRDYQYFLRDQIRIKAAFIAENFSDQTLLAAAGDLDEPATPQEVQAAIALLRDEYAVNYVIDIETDSTIVADEAREKGLMNEFAGQISGFFQNALQFAQSTPGMTVPITELLKAMVRRFKFGRSIEASFESGIEEMKQALQEQAGQPAPVDPVTQQLQLQAQIEREKTERGLQMEQIKLQQKSQEIQASAASDQANAAIEAKKLELEAARIALEREKLTAELEMERMKYNLELQKLQSEEAQRQEDRLLQWGMHKDTSGIAEKQAAVQPAPPVVLHVGGGTKVAKIETLPDGSKQAVIQEVTQ